LSFLLQDKQLIFNFFFQIIKEGDDKMTDVYIRYLGACSGCASSSTGTLFAIEAVLQEKLSKNIRILPI
jgi:NifU-like protein